MKRLYLFDADGACSVRISIDDHADFAEIARRNRAAAFKVDEAEHDIAWVRLVDGAMVVQAPPPRVQGVAERRYRAYPAIGDQLDALWHAMREGSMPMVPAFYDPIAAVKAAHPKPPEP